MASMIPYMDWDSYEKVLSVMYPDNPKDNYKMFITSYWNQIVMPPDITHISKLQIDWYAVVSDSYSYKGRVKDRVKDRNYGADMIISLPAGLKSLDSIEIGHFGKNESTGKIEFYPFTDSQEPRYKSRDLCLNLLIPESIVHVGDDALKRFNYFQTVRFTGLSSGFIREPVLS